MPKLNIPGVLKLTLSVQFLKSEAQMKKTSSMQKIMPAGGLESLQHHLCPCGGRRMFSVLLYLFHSNIPIFVLLVLHSRKPT